MRIDPRRRGCALLLVSAIVALSTAASLAQPAKPENTTQPAMTQPSAAPRTTTTRPASWIPRAPGPWNAALHMARSQDGLAFEATAKPIVRYAAAPTIARLPDGRILLVFEHYPRTDRRLFGSLGFSVSTDEGKTWPGPQPLDIDGLTRTAGSPRSPALTLAPDGEVHLFFVCKDRKNRGSVLCAVAQAGVQEVAHSSEAASQPADEKDKAALPAMPLSFKLTGRVALADKAVALEEVTVAYIGRECHLFGAFSNYAGQRYHGTSPDGRKFRRLDNLMVSDVGDGGSIVAIPAGLRFYATSRSGVVSAASADAKKWSREPGIRLSGGEDPAVVRLHDESWLMVYAKSPPAARGKRQPAQQDAEPAAEQRADQAAGGETPGEDAAAKAAAAKEGAVGEPGPAEETQPGEATEASGAGGSEEGPADAGPPTEAEPPTGAEAGVDDMQPTKPTEPGEQANIPAAGEGATPVQPDFQGFDYTDSGVPVPDFAHRIDYRAWFAQRHDADAVPDNAWNYYAALFFDPERGPTGGSALPAFFGMFSDTGYHGPPVPWNPTEHPEWEQASAAASPYVTRFAEAASHENYVRPVIYPSQEAAAGADPSDGQPRKDDDGSENLLIGMILPDLSSNRALVKQTLSDAWRAPDGKPDPQTMINAFDTCLSAAGHVGQGDTLIEQLVCVADKSLVEKNARYALQQGVFSPDQMESALNVLITRNQPLPDPGQLMAGELACSLDLTQYLFGVGEEGGGRTLKPERLKKVQELFGGEEGIKATPEELASTTADQVTRNFVDFYRNFTDMARRGYPDVKADDLDTLGRTYAENNYVAKAMLPSLSRAYQIINRSEASRRATQLSYAVHLYKARTGQWPQSLNDLPARYTEGARTDPFSGQDFVYRVTGEGFTIYSASENGRDDGGAHHSRWSDEKTDDGGDDFVFWPPQ